jgi:hypothetical protein|tara:strand:+ start:4258 stop:4422 length:165 start_codon:yes stop_codon:yes gene_type:complete
MKVMLELFKKNIVKVLTFLSIICLIGWLCDVVHPLIFVFVLLVSVFIDSFKIKM